MLIIIFLTVIDHFAQNCPKVPVVFVVQLHTAPSAASKSQSVPPHAAQTLHQRSDEPQYLHTSIYHCNRRFWCWYMMMTTIPMTTATSCYRNGSLRPHHHCHKDWSIVFTRWRRCVPPSNTQLPYTCQFSHFCMAHGFDQHRHILCFIYLWQITTTTIILWPLYRSACILSDAVLLPASAHALADGNQHIRTGEKILEFSSTELSTLSPYHSFIYFWKFHKPQKFPFSCRDLGAHLIDPDP